MSWIYNIMALIGLLCICGGIWDKWGWQYAIIVFGIVFMVLGIMGAANDTPEDPEQTQ